MPRTSNATRTTLQLDSKVWDRETFAAGLGTINDQAAALGVSRTQLYRLREGICAPGAEFIAAVRAVLPDVDERKLYRVVVKAAA